MSWWTVICWACRSHSELMTDRKVFTKMIPLYPDRWCWCFHVKWNSDEITCCLKCCLKGNLFLVRSSANLNEWWIWPHISMFNQSPAIQSECALCCGDEDLYLRFTNVIQSLTSSPVTCSLQGSLRWVWWRMCFLTANVCRWGIGFGYQVFEPPVSQRKLK